MRRRESYELARARRRLAELRLLAGATVSDVAHSSEYTPGYVAVIRRELGGKTQDARKLKPSTYSVIAMLQRRVSLRETAEACNLSKTRVQEIRRECERAGVRL